VFHLCVLAKVLLILQTVLCFTCRTVKRHSAGIETLKTNLLTYLLSFRFVADALVVERDKYKVIASDLDLTFTELAGYWTACLSHTLILASPRALTNCRHRFCFRFRSRSCSWNVHVVTNLCMYEIVFVSPRVLRYTSFTARAIRNVSQSVGLSVRLSVCFCMFYFTCISNRVQLCWNVLKHIGICFTVNILHNALEVFTCEIQRKALAKHYWNWFCLCYFLKLSRFRKTASQR